MGIQNGLVSIIVPVYNREQVVLRTIRCIQKQTYENIEYIIVDDGSSDHTYDVCMQAVRNDVRGKVLHKNNGGVSSARNMGIENACGQYVFFLDSDDMLAEDAVERLVEVILKYQCSLVQGSREVGPDYIKGQCIDMDYCEYYCSKAYEPVVWGKLYTRDLIGGIRFDENLPVREDVDFLYRIMQKAQRIVVLNLHLHICEAQAEHLNRRGESEFYLLDIAVSEKAIELFKAEEHREFKRKLWSEYFCALIMGYVYCGEKRRNIQKKFRKNLWNFWENNRRSFKNRILLLVSWISLYVYVIFFRRENNQRMINPD